MTLVPGMVTMDTTDPQRLAAWWREQTDGEVTVESPDFVLVVPKGGSVDLGFQRAPEPTPGKNRLHLDLAAPSREVEAARLVAAGATQIREHIEPGLAWTVMADPDGNEFCVFSESN